MVNRQDGSVAAPRKGGQPLRPASSNALPWIAGIRSVLDGMIYEQPPPKLSS